MKEILIVAMVLIFTAPSHAQDKASPPGGKSSNAPEPEAQNLYYQSPWDEGEIKSCSTYSGQPSLVPTCINRS